MASLGAGSLLAKIDIESAYRMVPVHPDDRPLLGVEWSGRIYCDAMLPFGLMQVISQDLHGSRRRITMDCSPKRGTAHRALPGRLRNGGRASLLSMRRQPANNESRLQGTGRSPGSREMRRPDVVPHFPRHRTRHRSLVPAPSRRQDHPHQGYFTGLERQKGMSQERATIPDWPSPARLQGCQAGTLVPSAHDKSAVRPIHLDLNRYFRADLSWWNTFISDWNGIAFMPSPADEHLHFSSDAAGSWGCGASWNLRWLQIPCMGCMIAPSLHFHKGDASHHHGSRSLGRAMARKAGHLLLRQPGCGCRPLVPRMPGGPVTQKLYRAKIVPGGTFLVTKFVPPRYTFGRQKCTGLAKSVPPRYNFGNQKCTGLAKSLPC